MVLLAVTRYIFRAVKYPKAKSTFLKWITKRICKGKRVDLTAEAIRRIKREHIIHNYVSNFIQKISYFFTYLCPEVGKFLQYISQNVKNNPKWSELNKEQLNKMNTVRQNYDLNGVNEVSKNKTGQQW